MSLRIVIARAGLKRPRWGCSVMRYVSVLECSVMPVVPSRKLGYGALGFKRARIVVGDILAFASFLHPPPPAHPVASVLQISRDFQIHLDIPSLPPHLNITQPPRLEPIHRNAPLPPPNHPSPPPPPPPSNPSTPPLKIPTHSHNSPPLPWEIPKIRSLQ